MLKAAMGGVGGWFGWGVGGDGPGMEQSLPDRIKKWYKTLEDAESYEEWLAAVLSHPAFRLQPSGYSLPPRRLPLRPHCGVLTCWGARSEVSKRGGDRSLVWIRAVHIPDIYRCSPVASRCKLLKTALYAPKDPGHQASHQIPPWKRHGAGHGGRGTAWGSGSGFPQSYFQI